MSTVLDPIFGCALATGRVDRDGYAFHGKTRAHIHAWEAVHGVITQTDDHGNRLELDHLCRRRNCCALHHLELVTRSENEKRKNWKYRARRTHCPKGHSMQNALVTNEGGRLCRTCHNEHKQGATT